MAAAVAAAAAEADSGDAPEQQRSHGYTLQNALALALRIAGGEPNPAVAGVVELLQREDANPDKEGSVWLLVQCGLGCRCATRG